MMQRIFYNSSLPRSGSTLLQNLIGQNPQFYVTPTSGVLELVFGARANYTESPEFKAQDSDEMRMAFRAFCRDGVNGFYSALTDKPYVVDKSRGWGYYSDFVNFFNPNPKIICMLRDPRCIFASMEKNHRKNPDKSGMTNDGQMANITTEQRVDTWVNTQPVGLAFHRLFQIIKEGRDKQMLFIKYEDLTRNPQKEMDRVYNYLEVEPYQHDFDNVKQITKEDDEVYGVFGDHIIRQKIEFINPDYKEVLGHQASQWIRQNYGWFYEYFKY